MRANLPAMRIAIAAAALGLALAPAASGRRPRDEHRAHRGHEQEDERERRPRKSHGRPAVVHEDRADVETAAAEGEWLLFVHGASLGPASKSGIRTRR